MRFVVVVDGTESVLDLAAIVRRRDEPAIKVLVARRSAALARILPTLHPFFRNAGLSLAEVLASRSESPAARAERVTTFERDWRDATELEDATTAALDALQAKATR
jgi:hypothetical protein